ncbi:MAG: hypothetical protein GY820_30615 [Gammaproteobacteria bacterium]|nr:hypothetical protein [Gammaproteobacteria bacterium]
MHGDREQSERETALRHLRKGKVRLLVATDVASRGLDVPDITYMHHATTHARTHARILSKSTSYLRYSTEANILDKEFAEN